MRSPRVWSGLAAALVVGTMAFACFTWRRRETSPAPPFLQVPATGTLQIAPYSWRVSRLARESYFKDIGRVNNDLTLKPTMGEAPDSITELRIARVAPESPLHSAGFRPNDRIVKVNGSPVTTLARALNLAHEVQQSNRLTVEVERSGQTVQYRFDFE